LQCTSVLLYRICKKKTYDDDEEELEDDEEEECEEDDDDDDEDDDDEDDALNEANRKGKESNTAQTDHFGVSRWKNHLVPSRFRLDVWICPCLCMSLSSPLCHDTTRDFLFAFIRALISTRDVMRFERQLEHWNLLQSFFCFLRSRVHTDVEIQQPSK
jgi:hypothetical protein